MKNPIVNTFKKVIESMPMQEMTSMYIYKLAKSEQCRDYELLALILVLRKIGYCKEEFYDKKIDELYRENCSELEEFFSELNILPFCDDFGR